jgi:hypothetical protein
MRDLTQISNRRQIALRLVGAISIFCSAGCARPPEPNPVLSTNVPEITPAPNATQFAATQIAAPLALVDYQDKGTHFQYPDNWKAKTDKEYELHLIPADGGGTRNVTFDIPDLPPHFDWMITMGRIESGYTDDLKKKHADLHIDSAVDHAIEGTKARLIQSSWKVNGVTYTDTGLLIIRKGQVYILTCDSDATNLAATKADFDKIIASLRWDK